MFASTFLGLETAFSDTSLLLGWGVFSFLGCGVFSFLDCETFSFVGWGVLSFLGCGDFSFLGGGADWGEVDVAEGKHRKEGLEERPGLKKKQDFKANTEKEVSMYNPY